MIWPVHLYAIVSSDDCIADENGDMPKALMNDADWRTFQAELDTCRFLVLGRHSHEAAPNHAGRLRVVMSRSLQGLERRADAWWWNPADMAFAQMAAIIAPDGGKAGVPGGQSVFEYFLKNGLTAFHLTRATRVVLPGGRKVFPGKASAEARLQSAGLVRDAPIVLDRENAILLTVWRQRCARKEN